MRTNHPGNTIHLPHPSLRPAILVFGPQIPAPRPPITRNKIQKPWHLLSFADFAIGPRKPASYQHLENTALVRIPACFHPTPAPTPSGKNLQNHCWRMLQYAKNDKFSPILCAKTTPPPPPATTTSNLLQIRKSVKSMVQKIAPLIPPRTPISPSTAESAKTTAKNFHNLLITITIHLTPPGIFLKNRGQKWTFPSANPPNTRALPPPAPRFWMIEVFRAY